VATYDRGDLEVEMTTPGESATPVSPQVPSEPAMPVLPSAPVMAVRQVTGPSRVVGKTRNPWGCWLLSFTIVYPLIWYFKINRELRDFDPSIDVQPGLSVLAMTLGVVLIFIPPIVSWAHTTSRIQKAQKLAGSRKRCSLLLAYLCWVFACVYIQSQLNKVWDQFGNPPEGTPIDA